MTTAANQLNIALVQTAQQREDKLANFQHLEDRFLQRIAPQTTDLILLPEMFNTGFTMNAAAMAEQMDGLSIQWLTKWAQVLDTQIGTTLIIEHQGHYYNRFVVVSARQVEAHYDKRHLFRMADEHHHFTPGDQRVIYSLKGWHLLLQTCYDLRFPVFSRNGLVGGRRSYDLAVYVANWPQKRRHSWQILLQARAIENQVFCVGVNRVGEDSDGTVYAGDSSAIDPWGNPLWQSAAHRETVQYCTLDRDLLRAIAQRFPALKDADCPRRG